jgi:cysteine desulfurase
MKTPIYLDNHATTRMDDRVLAAMLPYYKENFGNASSRQHSYGWAAEAAVEKARKEVAELIGAAPGEVVFTSGATESINLGLKGLAEASGRTRTQIITAPTEHLAVLDTCSRLEEYGFQVTRLPVDAFGLIDPDDVRRAITPDTLLVSIMMANNEIGTVQPVEAIASICRDAGVIFHSDATQAVPFLPMDVHATGIDLLSLSAHKFHGPKGVGALYVRSGVEVVPQVDGGGHERGRRSGTVNVPGIVGLGEAARLVHAEQEGYVPRIRASRDQLVVLLETKCGDVSFNGHPTQRLPNNISATFRGVRADRLIIEVRDVAMSTGAACSSASPEPSHVLRAIGLDREGAESTIRLGLSRFTTERDIECAADAIAEGVGRIRSKTAVIAQR